MGINFDSTQEIIDFAIEKEIEAANFYETASQQESMSGAKEMLVEFAQEEQKHQKILEELRAKGAVEGVSEYKFKWIPDIKRSDYVDEMTYKPNMAYHELLMLAMKREEKALALYNQMLSQAEGEGSKQVFKLLCQEEAKHKQALETKYDDYMAEMGD